MSALETNHGRPALGFNRVVASLVTLIASARDTRKIRKDLSSLSDRELDDIGLVRGDIERIARLR